MNEASCVLQGHICTACGKTRHPLLTHPFCNPKGEGFVRIPLDADEIDKLNWTAKTMNKTIDEVVEIFVRANLMKIEIKID